MLRANSAYFTPGNGLISGPIMLRANSAYFTQGSGLISGRHMLSSKRCILYSREWFDLETAHTE